MIFIAPLMNALAEMPMKIVISISNFQSDEKVINLLDQLYGGDYSFDAVIVVSSLGGEQIISHVRKSEYSNCFVFIFDENLGFVVSMPI